MAREKAAANRFGRNAKTQRSPAKPAGSTVSSQIQRWAEPQNDFIANLPDTDGLQARMNQTAGRIVQCWLHQHASSKVLLLSLTDTFFLAGDEEYVKRETYERAHNALKKVFGYKLIVNDKSKTSKSSTYAGIPRAARMTVETPPKHARFEPQTPSHTAPDAREEEVSGLPEEMKLQFQRGVLLNVLGLMLLSPCESISIEGLAVEFAKATNGFVKATKNIASRRLLLTGLTFHDFVSTFTKSQYLRRIKCKRNGNIEFASAIPSESITPKSDTIPCIQWGSRAHEYLNKQHLLDMSLNALNGLKFTRLADSTLRQAQEEVDNKIFTSGKKYIFDFETAYEKYYTKDERKKWDEIKKAVAGHRREEGINVWQKNLDQTVPWMRELAQGKQKRVARSAAKPSQGPKAKRPKVVINENANTTRITSPVVSDDGYDTVAGNIPSAAQPQPKPNGKRKSTSSTGATNGSDSSDDDDDPGNIDSENFIKNRPTNPDNDAGTADPAAELPGITPRPTKRARVQKPAAAAKKKADTIVKLPSATPSISNAAKSRKIAGKKVTARKSINKTHPLEARAAAVKANTTRSQPAKRAQKKPTPSKSSTQIMSNKEARAAIDEVPSPSRSSTSVAHHDAENSMDTPTVTDEGETRVLFTIDGPDNDRVQVQQRHLDSLEGSAHIDDIILQAYCYFLYKAHPAQWESFPIISPVQVKIALADVDNAVETLKPFAGVEGKRQGILFILVHDHHFIAVKVLLGSKPKQRPTQPASSLPSQSQSRSPAMVSIFDSMRGGFWQRANEVIKFVQLLTLVVPEMGDIARVRFLIGTYQRQLPGLNNCACFAVHAVHRWLTDPTKTPLNFQRAEFLDESNMRKTLRDSLDEKTAKPFSTFLMKSMTGPPKQCAYVYLQGETEINPSDRALTQGMQIMDYHKFLAEVESNLESASP